MMLSLLDGIGGTVHGSFFCVDESVDTTKPPGSTKTKCPECLSDTLYPIVTGRAFFFSPNFSWFLLACFVWWVAPYQLGNANITWQDQLRERLLVNHILAFSYVGFWHVALYWLHWGKRPFVANRTYQWGRVLHNIFYTWLGVLQWTVAEVAFLHCYQTGAIPYRHETLSLRHPSLLLLQTLIISIFLPNARDVHFYFAHRMIHTKFLYKYIHSVHHRNTDVEPFSGLCMHPLEHMFYYTCYAPCLVFPFHPFILFWMGVHVVISPAASHSGYEDHFSADMIHYIHHRHTDCNYGVPQSVPFDKWFGTFRDQMRVVDPLDDKKIAPVDPKARLGWIPDHPVFNASWILLWGTVWYARDFFLSRPLLGALLVSLGPVVLAWMGCLSNDVGKPARSVIAPFDKDPVWSRILHLGVGTLLGVLPATGLVYLTLSY